jgi:xanthine dehydrogenase accessory factor
MEMERLVELWKRAKSRGEDVYLATAVHVQGSSYRKPGARMLVTSGGERAGTISGGCLEADVSRKIAWLTQNGPSLQCYKSSFDDDDEGVPYGLGCGGTIWVLMEAGETVDAVLDAIRVALERRTAAVVVSSLSEDLPHRTLVVAEDEVDGPTASAFVPFPTEQVKRALSEQRTVASSSGDSSPLPQYICMPIQPSPRLHVFGAGDDAQPIVRFGAELGWEVTVADGRAHLLRSERFPQARHLNLLKFSNTFSSLQTRDLESDHGVSDGDCAVILTHSYEQDRALLKALVLRPLQYLGILGPLHRTRRLLDSICGELGLSMEECLARLHAPVGLNIGSGTPAVIALSIVAEIQAEIAGVDVSVGSHKRAFKIHTPPSHPVTLNNELSYIKPHGY